MSLEVKNVSHSFGDLKVLNNVNLKIEEGQIVALVGPSGCGKSTLLRAILGTHPPMQGEVIANGEKVIKPQRQVGIVYQHYSLFEFLTARQNVAFGAQLDQTSIHYRLFNYFKWKKQKEEHLAKADALLKKVGLGKALDHYPSEMSGGMQQRVAIAQALIMKPALLLLDEPFGALDEATREDLQMMLLTLYQENLEAKKKGNPAPHTILIVTHELNEALYVADRVIGLSQYHSDGKNGATIVYDQPAPIFHPNDERDFQVFNNIKDELRKKVFDPEQLQHYSEFVSFWESQESK
ncbi:MAG: ABC transporter ATP-binding protein [Lentisphaeraceae bacterium]|nr:ABC transporter ATP-binding protein [Lentisphaeraceae bacterium]